VKRLRPDALDGLSRSATAVLLEHAAGPRPIVVARDHGHIAALRRRGLIRVAANRRTTVLRPAARQLVATLLEPGQP
jgi:hypothetical protein